MRDPKLADDMRGFIGQEATHAETHDQVLDEFLTTHGVDYKPVLSLVEHVFTKTLAPSDSPIRAAGWRTCATGCGSSRRSSTTRRCWATSC